jgi:hypothetical protein
VKGVCDYGNGPLNSINDWEYLDQVNKHLLLNEHSVPEFALFMSHFKWQSDKMMWAKH